MDWGQGDAASGSGGIYYCLYFMRELSCFRWNWNFRVLGLA